MTPKSDWYNLIFQNSLEPILILEPSSGKIVDANPAVQQILGTPLDKLRGIPIFDLLSKRDRPKYIELLSEHVKFGGVKEYRVEIPSKKGKIPLLVTSFFIQPGKKRFLVLMVDTLDRVKQKEQSILNHHYRVIYDRRGIPEREYSTLKDITYLKKIEEDRALYSFAINQSQTEIAFTDLNGNVTFTNNAWADNHGYANEEMIGKHLSMFHYPSELQNVEALNRKLIKRGYAPGYIVHKRKDGSTYIALMQNFVVRVDNAPKYLVGVAIDVTERQKMTEELKSSEDQLRKIFMAGSVGISLVSLDGHFIRANPKLCHILGYTENELKKMTFGSVTHPDERARDFGQIKRMLSKKIRFYDVEKRYIRKDGKIIWCKIHVSVITDSFGKPLCFLTTTIDINHEKIAEQKLLEYKTNLEQLVVQRTQELAEKESFLSSILYAIPALIFVKDARTFQFKLMNKRTADLLGVDAQDILGKTDYDLFKKSEADAFRSADREVINSRKTAEIIEQLPDKNGIVYLRTQKTAVLGPNGKPKYLLGISEDITPLRELDILKSRFISSISHELRSPITPIKAQTQRLLALNLVNQEKQHALEIILRNTVRLDRLIQDLLEISRLQAGKLAISKKPGYLTDVIRMAISDSESLAIQRGITIRFTPKGGYLATFDHDRILEVMLNLLDNATKFGNARISITLSKKKHSLVVSVEDDGIGISKKDLRKIFEPFYASESSKRHLYGGSGLGLSISKGIIELHNGKIWVESKYGKGTKVSFELPIDGND